MFYGHVCAERPPKVTRRSERRNNLQICPRRDSNTGGSDLWSSTLPLDHGGALIDIQNLHILIYPKSCLLHRITQIQTRKPKYIREVAIIVWSRTSLKSRSSNYIGRVLDLSLSSVSLSGKIGIFFQRPIKS